MDPQEFIIKYCEILDQTHGQRPDKLWFSTWMSSKSPYFGFAKKFEAYWVSKQVPARLSGAKKIRLALRLLVTLCSLIAKSMLLKLIYRTELRQLRATKKINIVRTFRYSPSAETQDPFWGDLIGKLAKDNIPLVVIFEPQYSVLKCKQSYNSQHRNFPYQAFLKPWKLIKDYFALITESFSLFSLGGEEIFGGAPMRQILHDTYIEELLSPSALVTLGFYDVFSDLIERFEIDKLYLTFENNPWEKMAVFARKDSRKKFKIIGFQHSTVQLDATNYRMSSYETQHHLHPDTVFCSGLPALALLSTYACYSNVHLELGCALRYSHLGWSQAKSPFEDSSTGAMARWVVALDGTVDAGRLLQVTIEALEKAKYSGLEVRVREHPNFPITNIDSALLGHSLFSTGVIKIAHEPLLETLVWGDLVIYSGTTVALEALRLGKPLFQFSHSLFNFDPLFQFTDFKFSVTTADEMVAAWEHLRSLSDSEKQLRFKAGKSFAASYFNPCTCESIEGFLRV